MGTLNHRIKKEEHHKAYEKPIVTQLAEEARRTLMDHASRGSHDKKDLEMIRADEAKKLFYGQEEVSTRTLLDQTMTQGGIYRRQAKTRLDFSIILSKIRHEFQASTFSNLSHLAKVSRPTANELVHLQRSRDCLSALTRRREKRPPVCGWLPTRWAFLLDRVSSIVN